MTARDLPATMDDPVSAAILWFGFGVMALILAAIVVVLILGSPEQPEPRPRPEPRCGMRGCIRAAAYVSVHPDGTRVYTCPGDADRLEHARWKTLPLRDVTS